MTQIEMDQLDLDSIRKQIGRWLSGPNGGKLAAILAAQRGPDYPSERPNMPSSEHDKAYWARRKRKQQSGEVIRRASFYGLGTVGARSRSGDSITLPPEIKWDHYDKHQAQAAELLGLKVIISDSAVGGEQ